MALTEQDLSHAHKKVREILTHHGIPLAHTALVADLIHMVEGIATKPLLERIAELEQELAACKSRCNAAVGQSDALREEIKSKDKRIKDLEYECNELELELRSIYRELRDYPED